MMDDRATWIQHSRRLALFTSFFHFLQFSASFALGIRAESPILIAFGLDAFVSAIGALVLYFRAPGEWRNRYVGYANIAAGCVAALLGAYALWQGKMPIDGLLGILVAAVSMLVVPIIGSYMKTLAVELRSQTLKSAAVFTFGNSYLSMVLLIALLLNSAMGFRWGDPLGALVMFPFIAQKGIQILLEEGKHEYVED